MRFPTKCNARSTPKVVLDRLSTPHAPVQSGAGRRTAEMVKKIKIRRIFAISRFIRCCTTQNSYRTNRTETNGHLLFIFEYPSIGIIPDLY